MRPEHPHDWNVSPAEAIQIQNELRRRIIARDDFDPEKVRLVAGADISHGWRDDRFFTAVIVLTFPEMEIIEVKCVESRAGFPYVPGLLAFREGPAILKAMETLEHEPDVILMDGHGVAHPRGVGIASHIGVLLDKPTIGCAKSLLVGEHREPGTKKGCAAVVKAKGRAVGKALGSREGAKPIYVSVGHKISLETAVKIVNSCVKRYRLPEPTRQAHIHSNQFRKAAQSEG